MATTLWFRGSAFWSVNISVMAADIIFLEAEVTVNGPDVRDLGHQTRGPRAAFVLIYMLMGRTMVLCIFAVLCCPWFPCLSVPCQVAGHTQGW